MSTIKEIPERIWIELVISDLRFKMFVPEDKRTPKIASAYLWSKMRDPYRMPRGDYISYDDNKEFTEILEQLNETGGSEEHLKWRKILINHI
jgi:hypothetical protein